MVSKAILAALLASSSVFAAPATVQESLANMEHRSFYSASHVNYTRHVNVGKRTILLREEYARRNIFGLRAPSKEHDDNKKRHDDEHEKHG
ncbi:hypothetical protein F4809DRAFT_642082 [Biscogniauxia mediterranea]|nr:hypothetical protein F4809DRAFT_642082 [Biscogniauxia mediterranea]